MASIEANVSATSAGGRGINAASVIHSFGGQTLAVLICGGDAGTRLQEHLQCDGLQVRVVPVELGPDLLLGD